MSGSEYHVADSVIGTSGKPVRVYNATWLSDATARDLVLRNGNSASGDIWVQAPGDISNTVTINFEGGLLFPSGCFFDIGDAVSLAISFSEEL